MPISTLLLHCADDANFHDRARIALFLAKKYSSHIIALCLQPTAEERPVIHRGNVRGHLGPELKIAHQKTLDFQKKFMMECEQNGVSAEWVWEKGETVSILAQYSLYADIALVSQAPAANLEEMLFNYTPDHLSMSGACPTLILPRSFKKDLTLSHPLVAWKAERVASHAVRGSLPILRRADKVTVISIDPSEKDQEMNKRFITWLTQHGVTAVFEQIERKRRKIPSVIHEAAIQRGCDAIVMGGYGKSRLRELVLGGVTRSFLSKMDVPILMGH